MKMLYAPWREDYTVDTAHGPKGQEGLPAETCIFCEQLKENNDTHHFILRRFNYCYVVLNRYPYNGGHLLILPLAHVAKLEQLSKEMRYELMEIIAQSTTILERELKAPGINVGLNMGKAAGAGLPSHLHFHILPRWLGDTNFLPTIGHTKAVSTSLEDLYFKLKPHFNVSNCNL